MGEQTTHNLTDQEIWELESTTPCSKCGVRSDYRVLWLVVQYTRNQRIPVDANCDCFYEMDKEVISPIFSNQVIFNMLSGGQALLYHERLAEKHVQLLDFCMCKERLNLWENDHKMDDDYQYATVAHVRRVIGKLEDMRTLNIKGD